MEPPTREEWGPLVWRMVHLQAIAYADAPTAQDKQRAKAYYEAQFQFLPCPECIEHFVAVLQALPIDAHLDSPKQLIDWTHAIHNRVNERLGKPEISKQEFYKLYANDQAPGRCRDPKAAPAPPAAPAAAVAPAAPGLAFAKAAEIKRQDVPAEQQKPKAPAPAAPAQPPKQRVAVVRQSVVGRPSAMPARVLPSQRAAAPAIRSAPSKAALPKAPAARPLPMAGRRTLQMGPPKPVGHRATKGCTNCR